MPPEKESKPVDLTKQYGTKGPETGVFHYVHEAPEKSGFDLTGMIVDSGIVRGRKEVQYLFVAIAVMCILIGVFYHWISKRDVPPPHIYRAATDSSAHIRRY